jgi:hypothetical protein
VEAIRQALQVEGQLRKQAATECGNDGKGAMLKVQGLARALQEEIMNRENVSQKAAQESAEMMQGLSKQILSMENTILTIQGEAASRTGIIEDRSSQHYDHFVKSLEQKDKAVCQLTQRLEELMTEVALERSERKAVQCSLTTSSESIKSLEGKIQRLEDSNHQFLQSESNKRLELSKTLMNEISLNSKEVRALSNVVDEWSCATDAKLPSKTVPATDAKLPSKTVPAAPNLQPSPSPDDQSLQSMQSFSPFSSRRDAQGTPGSPLPSSGKIQPSNSPGKIEKYWKSEPLPSPTARNSSTRSSPNIAMPVRSITGRPVRTLAYSTTVQNPSPVTIQVNAKTIPVPVDGLVCKMWGA